MEDDLALTYEITKNAMRGYVEQTWGTWEEEEQVHKHRQNYTPATHQIVLIKGEPAGLIAVEDEPDYLWLVKLYILQEHRGKGIGTELLKQVLDHAIHTNKGVRLRVLRVNTKAQALYLRQGFVVTAETDQRLFMQSAASGA